MGAGVIVFPHAEFATRYAPVHQIRVLAMAGNRVRGLAAPDGGLRPSAVMLVAGTRILGVSIASGFSEEANSYGMRLGWCGFELAGLQHALALGPCAEIRCAATNRSLITFDDDAIAEAANSMTSLVTLESMRAAIQRDNGIEDPNAIWPFAEALFREEGVDTFLEACYRFFFDRSIDDEGRRHFKDFLIGGAQLREVWDILLTSAEFKDRLAQSSPGPFHPRFPFSLSYFVGKASDFVT
jgi:hypothetical protein